MAINIASYIANLGKSVSYAAVDRIKEKAPAIASFSENNAELFKSLYQNIREYKTTFRRGSDSFEKSKIYEASNQLKKSLFEDIKSGKFYNKEREDQLTSKATGMDDIPGFDIDTNFDTSFDTDMDSSSSSDSESMVGRIIKESGRTNTDAVSMAIAKTGEYITESQKTNNNILYTQGMQTYNMLNKNLSTINENMANIIQFSNEVSKVHMQNSKTYYEETTKLMQEQVQILKNISEALVPKKQDSHTSERITFSDITDAEGTPDISKYFKNVKKNISNKAGMLSMLTDSFGEDANPLLLAAASPLKFIPQFLIKSMVPKTIDKGLDQVNKSFSNLFGSIIAKFNKMADQYDNPLLSNLGDILGVNNRAKNDISTSNYEKGKIPWDGVAKKALVEVIPTQIAKIISLLSGKPEKMYDHDKGRFIEVTEIKKDFDRTLDRFSNDGTDVMRQQFNEFMKVMTFNSVQERDSLKKDIEKFLKSMYKSGKLFDYNSIDPDIDYSEYGVDDPKNFKMIYQMFKSSPKHKQHQINNDILKNRDSQTKYLEDLEKQGESIFNHLFNNSQLEEFLDTKTNNDGSKTTTSKSLIEKNNIKNVLDNKGHNLFYYLQNMYIELQYARMNGLSNTSSNRASRRRSPRVGIDSISIPESSSIINARTSRLNYERENRDNERYLSSERQRISEGNDKIVNVSDIDDSHIQNHLRDAFESNEIFKNIKRDQARAGKEPSLIDQLINAESVSAKSSVIMNTLSKLSRKPIKFFTGVLDKVDQRMYEVIYGQTDESGERRGFMGAFVYNVKNTFTRLNSWIDDNVLKPIKEKLQAKNLKEMGRKFLGLFGLSPEKIHDYFLGEDGLFTSTKDAIVNTFKGAYGTVKDSMKKVYGPIFNKFRRRDEFSNLDEPQRMSAFPDTSYLRRPDKSNTNYLRRQQPGLKTDEGQAVQGMASGLSGVISNWMYGNMPHYAEGSNGEIKKAHVATVGEGEAVLSKDNVTKLKDVLSNLIGSVGDGKKISNVARNAYSSLGNFARERNLGNSKIIDLFNSSEKEDDVQGLLKDLTPEQLEAYNRVKNSIYGKIKSTKDKAGELKDQASEVLQSDIAPFIQDVGKQLKTGATAATQALFGLDPESENKKFGEVMSDMGKGFKKYFPETIGSSLLGGGLSLVTGAIGGPLLGASIGAGVSLVKHSDKAQEWLFGKMVDGKREGGLVSPNTIDIFKKYFPDLKTYGIAGGITGLMPFVPFGPVGGALLGASYSYIKNNGTMQKMLFGDTGLISDKHKDKFKKLLPKAAAGALIGTFTGPFGLLGNALIGSATGIATDSKKFQELMIGKYNPKTKKYENGVLSDFRKHLIDPLKDGMKDFRTKIKDFLDNDIINPAKRFLDPAKQQLKLFGRSAIKGMGMLFNKFFEGSFGVPFHKFIEDTVVKPISNAVLKPLKLGVKVGKKVISAPFKAAGNLGDKLRAHQIRKGTADDMTAAEKLQFRKDHHTNGFIRKALGSDKYRSIDQFISNLSQQGLEDINEKTSILTFNNKEIKQRRANAMSEMGEALSSNFNYKDSKKIMKAIDSHDFNAATKLMNMKTNISGEKPEIFDYIRKHQNTINDMKSDELYKHNEMTDLISNKFGNDDETKTALLKLLSEKDKHGLEKALGKKLSEKDTKSFMSSLQSGYFDTLESNNKKKQDIYSKANDSLGDLVGEDAKSKILDKIKSGDLTLASQMLALQVNGSRENSKLNKASEYMNNYQSLKDKHKNVKGDINNILNQTYDYEEKEKIFKYLKKGDIKSVEKYIKKLPSNISNQLLEQLNPHFQKYIDIKNAKENSIDELRGHLFNSGYTGSQVTNVLKKSKNGDIKDALKMMDPSAMSADEQMELLSFMRSKHDRLQQIDDVTDNKDNIRQNLYDELYKQTGIKINDKNIDVFARNIQSELKNNKNNHYDSIDVEESQAKVKEAEMDMNKSYHNDMVTLFEKAIDLLQKVADPTKEVRTTQEVINERGKDKEETKSSNPVPPELREERQASDKVADQLFNSIEHYANGGMIKKAQVATLSSGEAVLDKDNVSKFLDTVQEMIKLNKEKLNKDDRRKVVTDTKGNVVEYKKTRSGEWIPDKGDASTNKALKNANEEEKANKSLLSRLADGFHKKKEAVKDKVKEKGSFLSHLLGGGGLLKKILGIGMGMAALPKLIEFGSKFLVPVMSNVYQNSFKPWLEKDAIPWITNKGIPMLGNVLSKGVTAIAENLPNMIAHAVKFAFTDLIPAFGRGLKKALGLSGEHGEESLEHRGASVVGRHIVTGGATSKFGLNRIGKKFSEKSTGGKAAQFLLHPTKTTLQMAGKGTVDAIEYGAKGAKNIHNVLTDKALEKINNYTGKDFVRKNAEKEAEEAATKKPGLMSRMADKFKDTKIGEKAADFTNTVKDKTKNVFESAVNGTKNIFAAIGQKAKSLLPNKAADKVTEMATKVKDNGGLVQSFVKGIKSFLEKLLSNPAVQKIIGGKKAQQLLDKFVPMVVKEISERALKAGAVITGKLLAAVGTGGLLNLAFAVADFVSGFRDAKNILSIDQEPSFGMKICAALIKSLSGLFMITAFIPEKIWANIIIDYVMPLFGKEDKELKELRDKAKKDVADYNKQHGTNYDVEQYNHEVKDKENKKPSLWEKVKNSNFAKGMVNMYDYAKDKLKNTGQWLAKKGAEAKQWAYDKMNQAGNWIGDKYNAGKNWLMSKLGIGGNGPDERQRQNYNINPNGKPNIIDNPNQRWLKGGFGDGDTVKNGMVYYSQGDPKWSSKPYGYKGTIKTSACGPTSAAMVLSSLTGKSITPVDTAQYSVDHGFRGSDGTSWGFFDSIGKKYGIDFNQTNDRSAILKALQNKQPVIFSGSGSAPFTSGGHFVVGAGMDGKNIEINDPIRIGRSKDYTENEVLGQMATAFISNKALDGKLVDNAGSTPNAQPGQDGQAPAPQPEKPSIASLFMDMGKATMNAMNKFYGFDAIDPLAGNSSSSGSQGVNTSSTPTGGLASASVVNYIKSKEGFRANRYLDSGGTPTIGYGSTHGWIMNKGSVTEAEATKALDEELQQTAKEIKANLDKHNVKLNQNEFDALCSFGYNLGTGALFKSTLYKKICGGDKGEDLRSEFMKFVHCGSQTLPGLVTRRKEEADIFFSGKAPAYAGAGGGFGTEKVQNFIKEKLGRGGDDTVITVDKLKSFFPAGKLRDNADVILKDSAKYGVDPALAASIMMMETGGKSYALDKQNNPAGISGNGGPKNFASIQDGIDFSIKNLKTTYFDKGLNTIEKIGSVYCPVGASNDPNGTNNEWVPGVKGFYKKLTGKDGLDGSVTASTAPGTPTDGSQQPQAQPEKPSIASLFMDAGKATMNALNKFYGFDAIDPLGGQQQSQNQTNSQAPTAKGALNPSSEHVADDFFEKTLGAKISSNIDPARHIRGHASPHFGIDYATKEGTEIKSPIDGVVYKNVANNGRSYGNYVVIKDSKGYYHYFAHMNKQSSLEVGAKVTEGETIGTVGQTGNATGPHLHYEVRGTDNNSKVNPNDYLKSLYNNGAAPTAIGGEKFKIKTQEGKPVMYGDQQNNSSISSQVISAILNVLIKISDNTSCLTQIVKILTESSGIKLDSNTKKKISDIRGNKGDIKNQVINVIKDHVKQNDNLDNQFLLNTLQALASE